MKKPDVLAFLAARYPLIPLRGKVPIPTAWPETALGAFPITELEKGNYGVVLGPRDLVVDVDPRNFTEGDKPLARLVADCGGPSAFKTFTVRTGGGGLHLYFSVPHDVTVVNGLDAYRGVEFKGAGRQVVGPGSIHPDTRKEYVVAVPGAIAPVPPALLELVTIKNKREELKNEKGEEVFNESESAQARYISYLESIAPLSVEGQNGDNTAFKVAAAGRDLGISAPICLSLLDTHWNPRCSPPWEADALADKVRHAYKYGKRSVGNADAARDFAPVQGAADAGRTELHQAAGGGDNRGTRSGEAPNRDARSADGEDSITWELDRDGKVKRTFHNLMNYLKLPKGGLFRIFGYNEFTGQVEFLNPAPWHHGRLPHGGTGGSGGMIQDHDIALLKGYLVARFGFEMPVGPLIEAVTNIAHSPGLKFHPVREYLDGLRGAWDGKPRLATWLTDYAGAEDNPYVRAVARKVLCAAVKRIYHPGCQFDHIMVLEGKQGVGKSQLVRALAGKWSADFPIDPSNKDTVDAMQGKWIVEMAEMSTLFSKRVEGAALKAFITRGTDRVRQAYGRLSREFPRQCIFIGTINPEADNTYLADSTGNRRFWPVEVGERIDVAGIKAARNQLFAEALIWAQKEEIYMDDSVLESEARKVVGSRHAEDPWTERIAAWLDEKTPGADERRTFTTSREIFVDALGGVDKQITKRETIRIATVMRSLGWNAHVKRVGERLVRGYGAPWAGTKEKQASQNKGPAPAAAPVADDLDGLV